MGLRAVALKLSPWNWARGSLLALLPLIGSNAPAAEIEQSRVDQLFGAFQAPHSPGCALGVIRNGALIYRKSYGAASLELNVPLSDQSVFYLASVSKQFTAASVVLASEQGFVSLDDSVRKYIPELPS